MDTYVLFHPVGADQVMVLGMRWHTILGSNLGRTARQRARQSKATHYAHAAGSEAVGVARLARPHRRRQAGAWHSAALVYAAGHPQGTTALCARLPDGRYWLVAAQDGKVLTQSDRVYGTREAAWAALEALRERHGPDMQVDEWDETAGGDDPSPALEDYADTPPVQASPGPLDHLAAQAQPQHRLQACGYGLPAVPRPVYVAGAAALLVLGGRQAWDLHRAHTAPPPAPAATVDAGQAWADVEHDFRRRVRVPTPAGWSSLLAGLSDLPLEVGGWRLQSARCHAALSGGWGCEARYVRHGRLATNASFVAAMPAAWRPAWLPLEAVDARFDIDGQALSLADVDLKPGAEHDVVTVTALQELLPALTRAAWGPAAPVRLELPRDAQGVPVPPPADRRPLVERPVAVDGPLRSLALLPDSLSGPFEWRSVSLVVDESASPSLNHSRLMAGLSGVLYGYE